MNHQQKLASEIARVAWLSGVAEMWETIWEDDDAGVSAKSAIGRAIEAAGSNDPTTQAACIKELERIV